MGKASEVFLNGTVSQMRRSVNDGEGDPAASLQE